MIHNSHYVFIKDISVLEKKNCPKLKKLSIDENFSNKKFRPSTETIYPYKHIRSATPIENTFRLFEIAVTNCPKQDIKKLNCSLLKLDQYNKNVLEVHINVRKILLISKCAKLRKIILIRPDLIINAHTYTKVKSLKFVHYGNVRKYVKDRSFRFVHGGKIVTGNKFLSLYNKI
jgi:hypothetical protein